MIFEPKQIRQHEVSVSELAALLRTGGALVVDVREPEEFSAGHIPGAINMALSPFRPSQLPDPGDKLLVLNCAAGRRSAMALNKCAAAQSEIDTHLAGGFSAWQAAGLEVEG